MTKSLCVTWITACDYPLFREWLRKYSSWFDEVLIYWDVQYRHPFYNAFIQQSLSKIPNIKFIDPVPYEFGKEDWRNVSTNELVKHAVGDWIISIEQDFFCYDWPRFFDWCKEYMELADLFGWMNLTNTPYIHPACFFIKRDLLEKTSKDFSAHPEINGSDHFATITYEANKMNARVRNLPFAMAVEPSSFAFHLGGVNQNYLNFDQLYEQKAIHRPEIFFVYNWISMLQAPIDNRFLQECARINYKLRELYPNLVVEDSPWLKYFQLGS